MKIHIQSCTRWIRDILIVTSALPQSEASSVTLFMVWYNSGQIPWSLRHWTPFSHLYMDYFSKWLEVKRMIRVGNVDIGKRPHWESHDVLWLSARILTKASGIKSAVSLTAFFCTLFDFSWCLTRNHLHNPSAMHLIRSCLTCTGQVKRALVATCKALLL